jgi:heptosyltransferase-2
MDSKASSGERERNKVTAKRMSRIVSSTYGFFKEIALFPTSAAAMRSFGDRFFLHAENGRDTSISLSAITRVLVVRLDGIGDMVLTTPFLRELRRNLPSAWITLVVAPSNFNLMETCPHVNEVLSCGWEDNSDIKRYHRLWRSFFFARKHLRLRRFDLAVLPRRGLDRLHASFLAYFSGAPFRVGFKGIVSEKPERVRAYFRNTDRLLSHGLCDNEPRHELQYGLELLKFLGGAVQDDSLELWLTEKDREDALKTLEAHGVSRADNVVAIGLGASDPKRQWPTPRFVELSEWLIRKFSARILLMGGKGDEPSARMLRSGCNGNTIDVVGKVSLRQATALLKRSNLFIGNDTGTMHMAAAAGVPVIEISSFPFHGNPLHPQSPMRFGPWKVPQLVLQPSKPIAPCSQACLAAEPHCILNVTLDQAKAAVISISKDLFS